MWRSLVRRTLVPGLLLAAMAGLAGAGDPSAPRVGQALEEQARTGYVAVPRPSRRGHQSHAAPSRSLSSLVTRLKAHV